MAVCCYGRASLNVRQTKNMSRHFVLKKIHTVSHIVWWFSKIPDNSIIVRNIIILTVETALVAVNCNPTVVNCQELNNYSWKSGIQHPIHSCKRLHVVSVIALFHHTIRSHSRCSHIRFPMRLNWNSITLNVFSSIAHQLHAIASDRK